MKMIKTLHIALLFLSFCVARNINIDSLKSGLEKLPTEEKIDRLIEIGKSLTMSDSLKAFNCFTDAIILSKAKNHKAGLANSYYAKGYFYETRNNPRNSSENYVIALSIYEELKNDCNRAKTLFALGRIYSNLGDLKKCLEYCYESIKICNDDTKKTRIGQTYLEISNVYRKFKQFEKAQEYNKKALAIAEQLNDSTMQANAFRAIGIIFGELKNWPKTIEYLTKSLEINKQIGEPHGIATSLANLAVLYTFTNDKDKAYERSLEAIKFYKQSDRKTGYIKTLINTSIIAAELKKHKEAVTFVKEADSLIIVTGIENLRLNLFGAYTAINQEQGNFEKALEYHIKYKSISDSLFNANSLSKVSELEEKFRNDIRELENQKLIKENELKDTKFRYSVIIGIVLIVSALLIGIFYYSKFKTSRKARLLLQEKKEIIENQNEQLEKLIATKDKIFSIIAHDLRNPFTALLGYTELMHKEYFETSDEEKLEMISMMKDSTNNAYKLLENLLHWSRSQSGLIKVEKEEINLNEIIQYVLNFHRPQIDTKHIETSSETEMNFHLYSDKIMLIIVLSNLINNAIKFTQKNGSVNVLAETEHQNLKIQVSDNGIGMSKEKAKHIFDLQGGSSTLGTENEKGTGLGLIICKEFVEKLEGKISVESEINQGTTFTIILPLNHQ